MGNLTSVGTNGGPSAYGTYDQTGNSSEILDSSGGFQLSYWCYSTNVTFLPRYLGYPISLRSSARSQTVGFRVVAKSFGADYVLVGNPGNGIDPWVDPSESATVFPVALGSVAQNYYIGKYEVTNSKYVEFLNSVAASDPYDLYSASMTSNVMGGITRSGASGSFTYSFKTDMGDKPVNFVTWFCAARYCNWLHNNKGSTETGAYTLNGALSSASAIPANSGAMFRLPVLNEWHKAAFYDPRKNNGAGGYWLYATQSNTAPCPVNASTTGFGLYNCITSAAGTNGANFGRSAIWSLIGASPYNVTTVGSNGGPSAYGTYDQFGSTMEIMDPDSSWVTFNFGLSSIAYETGLTAAVSKFNGGYYLLSLSLSNRSTQFRSYGFRMVSTDPYAATSSSFTLVSNPGNPNDSLSTTGLSIPSAVGSVSYDFRIQKYEVTNSEYALFLNRTAASDPYGTYNNAVSGGMVGITRSGADGSYSYSVVADWGDKPVQGVSWFCAARYCNWMHNGGGQGVSTESGAYTLNGQTGSAAVSIRANDGAKFRLPTASEWHKAGFYDPRKNSNSGGYWRFPTQSDSLPCTAHATSTGVGDGTWCSSSSSASMPPPPSSSSSGSIAPLAPNGIEMFYVPLGSEGVKACQGGYCPNADWYCCPDNFNCAATPGDCP